MVFGHDHVGLAVRLVAVGELTGHAVHGLDRVAELDAFDAAGGDERGGLLRDHADHTDPHAIDVLDAVFLKRRRTGALLVHVRAEIIPLRVALAVGADHAAGQVVVPLVELSRFSVAVPPVVPEAEIPMITGSWSEARN